MCMLRSVMWEVERRWKEGVQWRYHCMILPSQQSSRLPRRTRKSRHLPSEPLHYVHVHASLAMLLMMPRLFDLHCPLIHPLILSFSLLPSLTNFLPFCCCSDLLMGRRLLWQLKARGERSFPRAHSRELLVLSRLRSGSHLGWVMSCMSLPLRHLSVLPCQGQLTRQVELQHVHHGLHTECTCSICSHTKLVLVVVGVYISTLLM